MWPDRVANPGPLTYKSGALLTALRGPATGGEIFNLESFTPILGQGTPVCKRMSSKLHSGAPKFSKDLFSKS